MSVARLTYEEFVSSLQVHPQDPLDTMAPAEKTVYVYALTRDLCRGCETQKPLYEGLASKNSSLYILDSVETPIYSGTLHFWRTPPKTWNDRIQDLKDAHCNTLDTYIAWNWHEPEEGKYDFHGKTDPCRDLEGFLELVEKNGLHAIIRPGPYICGEWRKGGIPDWLLLGHPEIQSRDSNGKTLPHEAFYPPITYLHPNYLAYVEKWYNEACKVIRNHLYTHGGCIINVTIDDEPSYWETLTCPLLSDYNQFIIGSGSQPGIFQEWLGEEYGADIGLLNRKYHTAFNEFKGIAPRR